MTTFRPRPPLVIGLVGGVAAGKSTVAAGFAARGLVWLDADRIARTVTATPDVVAAIAAEFGADLVGDGGQLDREKLAERVFGAADGAARKRLEGIVHPAVHAALERGLAAAIDAGDSVVLDVPLLLETGWAERCDHIVFVAADEPTRRARATARGWDTDELDRREAHQTPVAEKRRRADAVLENGGPAAATERQVDALLAAWDPEPDAPSPGDP